MCQLLGMSCNVPTDIQFSLTGFQERGGRTADHIDGWGIAFFEGRGCRVFLDPDPAAHSSTARFVRSHPIRSRSVIAHIRKATRGPVALENTHPFQRELWGRYWIFAHNGTLDGYRPEAGDRFRPVGTTDSEAAFCDLLDRLARTFGGGTNGVEPEPDALTAAIADWTRRTARHGIFNFLLSDGRRLYAHCSTDLTYVERAAPFTVARLVDSDLEIDFSELTTPSDRVAVIATQPLTRDEAWMRLDANELAVFEDGRRVGFEAGAGRAERAGEGAGARPTGGR
jgi:glutamine amidotransferase